MATTVAQLASAVGGEVRGGGDVQLTAVQSIDTAGPQELTFCDGAAVKRLAACQAAAVLISREALKQVPGDGPLPVLIVVDDARAAMITALDLLHPEPPRASTGISPEAHISPTARIGAYTNIAAGVHVAADVTIGTECDLHPGVHIAAGCRLGNRVELHPGVVLYPGTVIGNDVTVHANSVLGSDGFGYRPVNGEHRKIPHRGIVRIEDDVEIGACTTIDRAMFGETVVGQGTKIDNQVMIAHNCRIGRHNILVGHVAFAGSASTDDYVICAGQSGVADHVHLGAGVVLGSKSGATKDLAGPGNFLGTPAIPAAEEFRFLAIRRKLPEMQKAIRRLEAQMEALKAQLESHDATDDDTGSPTSEAA